MDIQIKIILLFATVLMVYAYGAKDDRIGEPAPIVATASAVEESEILSANGKYFIEGVKSGTMRTRIK